MPATLSLANTLALTIGPVIAKAIAARWLKAPLSTELSSGLVEVVKSSAMDQLSQRRAQRQLEEIGERVAEALLPAFRAEGAFLDDDRCDAVTDAFREVLLHATPSMLARQDLDPAKLAAELLVECGAYARDFSEVESALLSRLVVESSQAVIDIAAELPGFTQSTIAELLRREQKLLDVAKRILDEQQRVRERSEGANSGSAARRFEEDYCREAIRLYDRVELLGADVSDASRRHRLSVAYVSLAVTSTGDEAGNRPIVGARDSLSVEQLLAQSKRLVIRGRAGSGKTTLLQWIAVRSAAEDFPPILRSWHDTVPFLVRLRDYAQASLPKPEELGGVLANNIIGRMPSLWIHQQLESGRAVVLIDGLDEVPEHRRDDIRLWVEGLVASFPNAAYVITARPHAITDKWMPCEGFRLADLQPMDTASVFEFIDHWHAAVQDELHSEAERDEVFSLARHMKETVEERRAIHNLATSPLLCAMLCALHRDRHRDIPRDRIELYHACCDLLINRLDREKRLELGDFPPLTPRQKRVLLEDLAYWMLRNNYAAVPWEEARNYLEQRVGNLQGIPADTSADRVLALLVARTGIVREPSRGQMDFTHRTFQEFLAAQAALDAGDVGVLVEQAREDRWREVVPLAVGLAHRSVADRVVSGLVQMGDATPAIRHEVHLLAVACVETAVELTPATTAAVQERLSQLVPPNSADEALALASAGDLATPYLGPVPHYEPQVAARCVRALARIGTEHALDTLGHYALDGREDVNTELLRAWDHFPRSDYAQRILTKAFAGHEFLELRSLPSLEGIEYLSSVNQIHLEECRQVRDLSPLARIHNVTRLGLSGRPIHEDIAYIGAMETLTALDLSRCVITGDLRVLSSLRHLRELDLSECQQISDLSLLGALAELTRLSLANCAGVADVRALATLSKLTELDISGCRLIADLGPLLHLPKLKVLKCDGLDSQVKLPFFMRRPKVAH